jgi:hypothetical protein
MVIDRQERHVSKIERLTRASLNTLVSFLLLSPWVTLAADLSVQPQQTIEALLRAQAFNKEFEGFGSYAVTIESDRLQADGSRDVIAVASGRFLGQEKRMKVEFVVAGGQIIGGQILEHTDLPPCTTSSLQSSL